ncbi:MAG: DUF1858 domain-containing protein [Mesorhizobium sp.]|nr:DUF1858 domain-containing protein [Mesorhizobium sp.]
MNAASRPPPRQSLSPETSVDDVMRMWPATIAVFLQHRFLCVGCPIAPFHTIRDVCQAHETDEAAFRHDIVHTAFGQE